MLSSMYMCKAANRSYATHLMLHVLPSTVHAHSCLCWSCLLSFLFGGHERVVTETLLAQEAAQE